MPAIDAPVTSTRRFLLGSARLGLALTIAGVSLSFLFGLAFWIYSARRESKAQALEVAKDWKADASENLNVNIVAKTKLVDSKLLAVYSVDGYPRFLSDPRMAAVNQNRGITFIFEDKDGFKVHEKYLPISSFTYIVDGAGERRGLQASIEEFLSEAEYARIARLTITWNLETQETSRLDSTDTDDSAGDHCAPNISRTERLRRLRALGEMRQNGSDTYSVGDHEVTFMPSYLNGGLLSCR